MEADTMFTGNGEQVYTPLTTHHPLERKTRRRTNWPRLALVFVVLASLAGLAAVGVAKYMPNGDEPTNTASRKGDIEDLALNAVFSTSYLGNDCSQLLDVINLKDIENQLNSRTKKRNRLRLIGAFFRPHSAVERMKCVNPLSGHLLQLDLVIASSRDCTNRSDSSCTVQRQKELKDALNRAESIPISVQLGAGVTEKMQIKLCSIIGLTKEGDEVMVEAPSKAESVDSSTVATEAAAPARVLQPKQGRVRPVDGGFQSMAARNARCSLCINKLGLVQMPAEFDSRIDDDLLRNGFLNNDQNRQHLTATVYEDGIYRLQVQLDCGGQLGRDTLDSPCSRSLSVFVWIDYNDNEYDDRESRLLRRAWSEYSTPTGAYELDIRIPLIDGRDVKSGRHRMRISVIPSEEYQRECGTLTYSEVKDYSINIYPKARPIIVTTTPYRNPICFVNFPKIILVLMGGEKGTEIRDDIPRNSLMNNHPNRHHTAVTLFEATVYLIRIQLDCTTQLKTDLTPMGCNLAQDVLIWIDLNNDGVFSDSELGTPHRWPVTSYMAEGIYDLQISVPSLANRYVTSGPHRMRITVLPSDYYIRNCGYNAYNETREYSVEITPRVRYSVLAALATPPPVITDFECSSDVGRIVLVVAAGEYRTQIRDDSSTTAAMNMINRYEQHRAIVLYEEVTYLLRIQLECTQQRDRGHLRTNCTLPHDVTAFIDLNDDGVFDPSENAAPFRWPLTSYVPEGVYDLQIYVPIIDGNKIRSGPHLLRLVVTLDEQYRRKCGKNYFTETRQYNVTIVRPNTQLVDTGLPNLRLNDNACSQSNAKIVLVIMTGELGTHIRDDTPMNTLVGDNQNRHHLAVTLYENTVYRIRIQLDCDRPSSKGSYDINCNLAQDVNVYIDHDNNGRYDENESHVSNRWPLQNSMGLGIYDLNLAIPSISEWNMKSGAHRVRVVISSSEEYNRKCGKSDFQELREYTFNIIPRVTTYGSVYVPPAPAPAPVFRSAHCSPGSLVCSNDYGAISLVRLIGERGSQVDDRTRVCSATNNYDDQSDLVVTLFDRSAYTLQVELTCTKQESDYGAYDEPSSDNSCKQASYLDLWIDFDDNGVFDDNREHISSADRYGNDNRKPQRSLRLDIPAIDGRSFVAGSHRMRLILRNDERGRGPCQNSGFGEARDYTVQITQK